MRAAAIVKVSGKAIEAAKVEVKSLEVTGAQPGAGFFPVRTLLPGRDGKAMSEGSRGKLEKMPEKSPFRLLRQAKRG